MMMWLDRRVARTGLAGRASAGLRTAYLGDEQIIEPIAIHVCGGEFTADAFDGNGRQRGVGELERRVFLGPWPGSRGRRTSGEAIRC